MKKCKWINRLLAIAVIGFVATFNISCGNNTGGTSLPPQEIKPNNYYEITENMEFKANSKSDVYMIIYNTGSDLIESDDYKNIYPLPNNQTPTILSSYQNTMNNNFSDDYDFSHYSCGLALESVRNAYKLVKSGSTSSRSASGYNKTKFQKAKEEGDEISGLWVEKLTTQGTREYKSIDAYCVASNDVCQVFIEKDFYDNTSTGDLITGYDKNNPDNIKITKKGAEKLAEKFSKIYRAEQTLLGSSSLNGISFPYIIETSEKITILISSLGHTGSSYVGGYFAPNDLFCDCDENGVMTENGQTYYTNQRQMFVLNNVAFQNINETYSTLGHEFNHMLNYINKILKYNLRYDVWFTEMLSATAEDFLPDYLGTADPDTYNAVQSLRISYLRNSTHEGMVYWEDINGNTEKGYSKDVLTSYSFAYTFGAYLIRNYGGVKFLHELATNKYIDTEAINQALKSCGYTKETYDTVLQKFGLIYTNYDGKDKSSPTLYKTINGYCNGYNYKFTDILLSDWSVLESEATNIHSISKLATKIGNNTYYRGPFALNPGIYQKYIRGGGFSVSYLGTLNPGTYTQTFNAPTNPNLKAYIYVKPVN